MKLRRTLAFTKKVLKQLRHDKRTFAFILVMPLLMILVFGYTFGGEVSHARVVVVNQDTESELFVPDISGQGGTSVELNLGDEIVDQLDGETLDIRKMDDYGEAKDLVRTTQFYDKVWAVIYIPSNFSSAFTELLQRQSVAKALTNQTSCEGAGLFWYDGFCHATAYSEADPHDGEEACKDAGYKWYNNKCHERLDDTGEWGRDRCASMGYLWYDDRCHDGAELTLVVDGSNPNVVSAIKIELSTSVMKAHDQVLEKDPELKRFEVENPLVQREDYAYGSGDIEFIDSFAPAIMAFAMMMVTTMITIFLFIEERKMGTLDRLLASPAKESEIVLGYAMAFSIVSLLQATVILMVAIGLFGIYIAEPKFLQILTAYLFLILLGMGHQCLGIMLSSGAKNELQAIQFIPLIIFPSILLCGFLWPIESIPAILRPLSYFIPLTYAIDAVRSAMVRGLGIESLCCHGVALIFFTLVMLLGAIMLLKRRR